MMLVSIDEPSAAYATMSNMLFASVDVHPFVIALDYHPVKVRICQVLKRMAQHGDVACIAAVSPISTASR
jgi:hypothetical protein